MDALVSWTGLSSSGREFIFLTCVCWLSLTERGLWSLSLQQLDLPFFHIKAAADWFHWITNYNLWQLICFCSQLQMPLGKCQCVRAHAHHIISVRQWPAEKNMSISHSREKKKFKKKKQCFILSGCCCCVREGTHLVIGAVLPSGQNTPKVTEGKKSPFLSVSFTGLHQSHKQKTWSN